MSASLSSDSFKGFSFPLSPLPANAREACGGFRYSLADGEALNGSLLLGETEGGGISLLHVLGLLNAHELDVAVGGQVGADTTVGTVSATTARDGSLHDDVVDHAVIDVELSLLGVGLEVDEELSDGLN